MFSIVSEGRGREGDGELQQMKQSFGFSDQIKYRLFLPIDIEAKVLMDCMSTLSQFVFVALLFLMHSRHLIKSVAIRVAADP